MTKAVVYKQTINNRVVDIISALLLLILLYTAVSKLADLHQFRYTLSESILLEPFAGLLAWLIPSIEIIIAIFLFLPSFRLTGLWCSALLLSVFTIYLVYMINVDNDLPCSCGGIVSRLSWKQHILFNLVLMLLSIIGIYRYQQKKFREKPPAQEAAY